ncbi:hypothetical protein [Bailinhaonella thermotolerans]|uniref:Uncharacterized protein n=1 Tax=Bailinhaonella thermotolerans TaxID=1070861 RepID=A0A3A4BL80_9ACTN|nr:hypothetical protein [Bailinhaonella thermotolerans]RJL36124.1 hypothetical protein D5H75_05075 [Bailinhaonella thermotolerans]
MTPEEFTGERERAVREARDAGDARLAKEVAKLRRPRLSAWAVNLLAHEAPDRLGGLVELGAELQRAWAEQDRDALAEVTQRRGPLIQELVRLARELAERGGHPLAPSAVLEVERTLDAATVDADAAERVAAGHLVQPLAYTGFAPTPVPKAPARKPGPSEKTPDKAAAPGKTEKTGKTGKTEETAARAGRGKKAAPVRDLEGARRRREEERRERERERRRAEEERRERARAEAAAAAVRAAEEAERHHAEWAAELAQAVRDHEELTGRIADLTARLEEARTALAAADRRRQVAEREESRARRLASTARSRARTATRDTP